MKPEVFQLSNPTPGVRLDKYIASVIPTFSRARIQKLISEKNILVNEHVAKASQKLSGSDTISVNLPPPFTPHHAAEAITLSIIYQDNDVLVIDKPAGMVIHPSPGHPSATLVNALLSCCPGISTSSDSARPGIVHRLDKDTSGLIVCVKNDPAKQHLANQFKSHTVQKEYLALVKGKLQPEQGTIKSFIGRDPDNRKRMAVVEEGKEAVTEYRVIKYLDNLSLLEVNLRTGRTHQIRVHLTAIGHPVIGDTIYGVKSPYIGRQFLHAHRLGFRLPSTGVYREFVSQLPPDLEHCLNLLEDRPVKNTRRRHPGKII